MKGAIEKAQEIARRDAERLDAAAVREPRQRRGPRAHHRRGDPRGLPGRARRAHHRRGHGRPHHRLAQVLKKAWPKLKVFAVEPTRLAGDLRRQAHAAPDPGHRRRLHPAEPRTRLLDGTIQVEDEDAKEFARQALPAKGCSSASPRAPPWPPSPQAEGDADGQPVLGFNYDTGERYLSIENFLPPEPEATRTPVDEAEYIEITLHLLGALVAGGVIGLERSFQAARRVSHPCAGVPGLEPADAGHALPGWLPRHAASVRTDPTRMAQGIMTGIGFLGAGVIFKEGLTVRGLTTAASIWITAAIGILSASASTCRRCRDDVDAGRAPCFAGSRTGCRGSLYAHYVIRFARATDGKTIRALLKRNDFSIANISYRLTGDGKTFEYRMVIRTTERTQTHAALGQCLAEGCRGCVRSGFRRPRRLGRSPDAPLAHPPQRGRRQRPGEARSAAAAGRVGSVSCVEGHARAGRTNRMLAELSDGGARRQSRSRNMK